MTARHLGLCAMLVLMAGFSNARHATDLSAFVGRWQLNSDKTRMGRFGPDGHNMVRSPTFTFIFVADGANLQNNVYAEYPQPAPTRTMALIPDGKPHACESQAACLTAGGDRAQQSYIYRSVDSHYLVRLFRVKGRVTEYSTYAVSADGKTFTLISWSAETPYYQNIQVFEKQR
jgi:hypothetical protein